MESFWEILIIDEFFWILLKIFNEGKEFDCYMYLLDIVLWIVDDVIVVGILVVEVLKSVIFVVKVNIIYRINLMWLNFKFDLEFIYDEIEKKLLERNIYFFGDVLKMFLDKMKVGIFVI